MILPSENKRASAIIAKKSAISNMNILGPSYLAQRCQALIESDRYLALCDSDPVQDDPPVMVVAVRD